jgi:hypothetical protein
LPFAVPNEIDFAHDPVLQSEFGIWARCDLKRDREHFGYFKSETFLHFVMERAVVPKYAYFSHNLRDLFGLTVEQFLTFVKPPFLDHFCFQNKLKLEADVLLRSLDFNASAKRLPLLDNWILLLTLEDELNTNAGPH